MYREEELLEDLAGRGLAWNDLQKAFSVATGIDIKQLGTLENADTVIGGPWPTPLFGSKRHRCELCEGFVSLAPSSQRMLQARPETRILCLRCAKTECAE
jgi:hypothetical protein